jgi:hypothetical protein
MGDLSVERLQDTNQQWQRRLDVVQAMEGWMARNLSPFVKVGREIQLRRMDEFKSKGREYLYCHLLLGKTIHPGGDDPLFTDADYADASFRMQLELDGTGRSSRGEYVNAFKATMLHYRKRYSPPAIVRIADVKRRYLTPSSAAVIDGLRGSLTGKYPPEVCDELIIGLILRYRCIGGFDSNQHGSIARAWGADEFFQGFTECFASPLNHLFKSYFSVFEEDEVFGSHGNFWSGRGDHTEDDLSGDFEMNPPFEEAILDRSADMVCRTFRNPECASRLVMFTPNWKDSPFFWKLNALTQALKPTQHALQVEHRLQYEHVSDDAPRVRSIMFVFVGRKRTDASEFISKCRHMISASIVGRRNDVADTSAPLKASNQHCSCFF